MRRTRASTEPRSLLEDDEGNASLEFIVAGLILLAPLVYLIVALGAIQSQALGVEAAARHVARAVSTAANAEDAAARADLVLAAVADEYGIDPDAVTLRWECAPAGVACPSAGATLLLSVSADVPLPLVPPVLGLDQLASVPVEASAAQKVSRLWGTTP
ncbi:TadE family protein [Microbacterium sp. BG28]|uniref:TadE family protein n=1 Tax=Microbacterium sp. BG28 TaxID=3097356 RepID=UPI002A599545|nr:TadE family protein [Microbacterium sp. BG28]MDY0828894.1 TadE family protein [Microbacterium sp. BG28]